jgi:hypothetical protein
MLHRAGSVATLTSMPRRRKDAHLFELARRGAEHRYRELKAEIASLLKIFPHLRFGSAVSPSMPDAVEEGRAPHRRRRLSAAQRKAVSERMRKYWAQRRARTQGQK